MTDITDAQDVADDAVAVAVKAFTVGFQIVDDHLALQHSTLDCIKADIVGLSVERQGVHIQFARRAVGRLTVVPDHGLLCVGDICGGDADDTQQHHNCHDQGQDLLHRDTLLFNLFMRFLRIENDLATICITADVLFPDLYSINVSLAVRIIAYILS